MHTECLHVPCSHGAQESRHPPCGPCPRTCLLACLSFRFPFTRLGTYSANAATVPPAAVVATKALAADPRAEPKFGERVPYVVVHGEPGECCTAHTALTAWQLGCTWSGRVGPPSHTRPFMLVHECHARTLIRHAHVSLCGCLADTRLVDMVVSQSACELVKRAIAVNHLACKAILIFCPGARLLHMAVSQSACGIGNKCHWFESFYV